ncbi:MULTISPECIES: hypothetical protein [unclassified Streptomyces]|uniref:hypothetical protein n=1 Tax=unclassified Streptomyces TaxID=2593676 RepID=UPI00039CA2F3|nr:hypothetical protein [Streptomyces sp. BoleA5]
MKGARPGARGEACGADFFAVEIMDGELRRLRSGPRAKDGGRQPFLVRVRFTAEDPGQVIADARAVLTCVVERMGDWPACERWPQLLPAWFVQRCAPEPEDPEPGEPFDAEAWPRQWRAMTPEQRAAAGQGPWTLSDWLHCFDPTEEGAGDDRSWWWWHAGTDEPGSGWIQVATTGWPFGRGSLSWLIKAGGGTDPAYGP